MSSFILLACAQPAIPHWVLSMAMLLGGASVGLGIGMLIGADVMRERIGKALREQRAQQAAKRRWVPVLDARRRHG